MPVTSDALSVSVESADISDETSPSEGPDHNMILVPSEVSSVSAQPAAIPATTPNPKPSAQANTKPKEQRGPLNDQEKSDIGQVFQDMIKSHQKVTVEAVRGISDETSPSDGPDHNMIPVPSEVSSVSAQPAAIPATNPNRKPSAQTKTRPKQQKRDIGQVFQDMIKSHQKVTVEAVRGISDETSPSEGPDHNMIPVPSEVSSVSAQPAAIPATNPKPKPSTQTNTKTKQQKRPLNDLEKSDIGQVFQDMIKSHEKVTVRGKLKNSTKLQHLLTIDGMDVKVADRVRLCQTKSKSEAGGESKSESRPQQIPATSKYRAVQAAISQVNSSEVDEYDIESEEVETGTRQEWSEEDTKKHSRKLRKRENMSEKDGNKNDNKRQPEGHS